MRAISLLCLSLPLLFSNVALAQTDAAELWQAVVSSDGSTAQARHESAAIEVNGKLYLIGGRAFREVQMFDPVTSSWTNLGQTPLEIHHFQPVAIGNLIYLIGGLSCCYPAEDVVTDIHIFNTQSNTWSIDGSMPASRARGSAGAVVYNNKIYVLGGNTLGHSGGAVAWFDEYDPATQEWTVLPDAPNARDHFSTVLINDYLIAAAGRQTSLPNPFTNAVVETDVYDFVSNEWITTGDIPTARAGAVAVAAGDEVIVAGGEINTSTTALNVVEAMNIYTGQWRTLQPLMIGRHSGGGAVLDGRFHVVAGSLNTGGAPETQTHEALLIDETQSLDFDADGLSNTDEIRVYGTNPGSSDTDADGLSDAIEIQVGFNPLVADSDGNGVLDGNEDLKPTPVDMSVEEPVDQSVNQTDSQSMEEAPGTVTEGGNVSIWLLVALLVGSLSRIRLVMRQLFVEK